MATGKRTTQPRQRDTLTGFYAGFAHPHGQVTCVRARGDDIVVRFVWGHEAVVSHDDVVLEAMR